MSVVFRFDDDPELKNVRIGLVEASGLSWNGASLGLDDRFQECLNEFRATNGSIVSKERKAAVRAMLRKGKYRPAGRGKPSSEYLFAAALEGAFPAINFFVDAANLVSLVSGYPISLIDGEKAGASLHLRLGRPGECYVFNEGEQRIDVEDLVCVCRNDGNDCVPTANPVRDSMATKLFAPARSAIAVIYAPQGQEGQDLESACDHLAGLLSEQSEAVHWAIVVPRPAKVQET